MSKYNPSLARIALAAILEKSALVPADQMGMPPGGDPAAAGMPPGAPMDPAAMMAGGGAPPMDPAAMGGAPVDPSMMAMDPAAMGDEEAPPEEGLAPDGLPEPEEQEPDIKEQIKQVLTEAGIVKPPKLKPEEQFAYLRSALEAIAKQVGAKLPPLPDPAAAENTKDPMAEAMKAVGAGMSGGTSSQALGSMDSQQIDLSGGQMPKAASVGEVIQHKIAMFKARKR